MNSLTFKTSLLLMGMSGIVAQIILLREFLISFYGNELTLGIILANWLILEAAGSFAIGRSVERTSRKIECYVLFQLIFSIAFPFSIYLCRVFKNLILVTPGEGLGFATIFCSSFLILLPICLPHGALFTYGAKIHSQSIAEASSIGRVYVFETIGSTVGGLLATFLFIQYLNSFQIAFTIALLNTLISVLLLWPLCRPLVVSRSGLCILSISLTAFFGLLLITSASREIDRSSVQSQWKDLNVIRNENSIYGNITVTKMGDQITFFTDGTPSITVPVPDIGSLEDLVHFPMLFHERPESILVLGGGAGGMVREILKHPVSRLDYVELDPLLLKLIHDISAPLAQSELSDRRVKIHETDGRFFVKRTQDRFDVIFIGLAAPQELQTNRLFSAEFFSITKKKITPEGILVLRLPGSLTYISPELRDLNGCIWDTLRSIYRLVRVIPGDVNIYLASDSDRLAKVTAGEVIQRLEERKVKTGLFTMGYVEDRLHQRWQKWFSESMGEREVRINSDFRPLGVFFALSHWNALFSPYLAGVFKWFEGLSLKWMIGMMVLFTLVVMGLFLKRPALSRGSLPYAIFTTGLAGMIFNLAIIFTFQTFYGYLYYQIGLLITTFMVGIAVSGFYVTRRPDQRGNNSGLFLRIEVFIIFFAAVFPFLFSLPSGRLQETAVYVLVYALFLAMSFLSGTLIGLEFPLATRIYLDTVSRNKRVGQVAGLFYGVDLLGGFLGGLVGGILLLPLLGLKESCFILAVIKISSAVLFLLFKKIRKAP